jgi:1-pyrroline-4-hydroxy-2-carboxylate deaminase
MHWKGVMPAVTTCFDEKYRVDHKFMAAHCRWLIDNGCSGIVVLGSLGEGATLTFEEKLEILSNIKSALGNSAPLVAAISALSTDEAVRLAEGAKENCDGLMVLPPYVYQGDWREMKQHVSAILRATPLSCMLYNNPIAYGTDFTPTQIDELADEHENLHAVKESSTDTRRVSGIQALIGQRLSILAGVDDGIVEAIGVGAAGWIAGLANALPRESVELFRLASNRQQEKAFELYRWFLPLLRLDTVVKFVQFIKLVQAEVGIGNARVRPPRLELIGDEREQIQDLIRKALARRPGQYQTKPLSHAMQ